MSASDYMLPETVEPVVLRDGLPASVDTERRILGCILLDNLHLADLLSICRVEDFSLDSHRILLQRMEKMEGAGIAIDDQTLVDQLIANRELDSIGNLPVSYITSLTEGAYRVHNIKEYADRVLELSMRRKTMVLASELTRRAIESTETSSELLAFASERVGAISEHFPQVTLESQSEAEFELLLQQRHGEATLFLSSGIDPLDAFSGGYAKGELTVIGGRPKQGKSATISAMAAENCPKGHAGHISTVEMLSGQLLRRIWSRVACVPFWKLRRSELMNESELSCVRGAMRDVARWPLTIDDSTNLTAADICHRVRVEKRKKNLEWAAVDYLQKLDFGQNEAQKFAKITAAAQMFAKLAKSEYLAVLLLSSITEKNGTHRNSPPTMQNLRGSGDIAFEANAVYLIHREINEETEKLFSSGQFIQAAARSDEGGAFDVEFDRDFLMFKNKGG